MNNLYVKGLALLTTGGYGGDRSDPISRFCDIILELIMPFQSQIQVVSVCVIIGSAVVYMCPFFDAEWKKKATKWIISLIAGAILLIGATEYGGYISNRIKF